MDSPIDMTSILIANGLGLAVLFVVGLGNAWRLRIQTKENKALVSLYFVTIITSIITPICFYADGKPGTFFFVLNYVTNLWLYLAGVVFAFAWIMFIVSHLNLKLARWHHAFIGTTSTICLVIIFGNFFKPFLFSFENNVYKRESLYWVNFILHTILLVDGLFLYIYAKKKSGELKFFQVGALTLPMLVGELIQAIFYGLSTATPFLTASIAGLAICLQNEILFRDELTSLFNRYYLNVLQFRLSKKKNHNYMAFMLDLNGFKLINDQYGHRVGDEALVKMSQILNEVINFKGTVIRYAGDEFIVILNSNDDKVANQTIADLHKAVDDFNAKKEAPYTLSFAIGCCKLDFKNSKMDEFVDNIDRLMYENKREYYSQHTEMNRRKR